MTTHPPISPDDLALWREVTRGDRKLHTEKSEEEFAVSQEQHIPVHPVLPMRAAPRRAASTLSALVIGDLGQVDKASAAKLKQGRWPVDRVLDLHGMTRVQAQQLIMNAIPEAQHKAMRCVLVITGKGTRMRSEDGESGGVLRRLLPVWLNLPELRPFVLAVTPAQPARGGEGAYYVLLKRKRSHA